MTKEMKHLRFVLKYYAPGVFDTRKALRAYKSQHPVTLSYWSRYIAGVAAAIAVCFGIGYYFLSHSAGPTLLQAYNEAVAYTLPDNSEVILYPHSSLSYYSDKFGKTERHVDMTGKVRFKVQKNPASPFIASATSASVRVLGTEFTVDGLNPDSTGVSVTSGKVLFKANGSNGGVILTKGMEAYLLTGDTIPDVVTNNNDITATQTTRKFIYDNTPLADVLKDLSGHFNVQLVCNSPDKMLTAEFDTDNIDEIIMIIEKSLDVKILKKQTR